MAWQKTDAKGERLQAACAIKYSLCHFSSCLQRACHLLGLVFNNIPTAWSLGATSQTNSSLGNIRADSQKTSLSVIHSCSPCFPKTMLTNDSRVTWDKAKIILNLESEGWLSGCVMTGLTLWHVSSWPLCALQSLSVKKGGNYAGNDVSDVLLKP